ncbi:hypothetical protein DPF89_02761 [Salmonella enterica subsp. enterica serovar Napoli]|nr:hypothetical protein DPF89_02761 [Salmonella enterica subsp. enterica serovar Napoli]
MRKHDAIIFFGSKTKLARAAGVRLSSIYARENWFQKVELCAYRKPQMVSCTTTKISTISIVKPDVLEGLNNHDHP